MAAHGFARAFQNLLMNPTGALIAVDGYLIPNLDQAPAEVNSVYKFSPQLNAVGLWARYYLKWSDFALLE